MTAAKAKSKAVDHAARSFARKFDTRAAGRCTDAWWLDLLRLWRPSGVAAGERGLRLAVRNGYLNFYRLGQSVAMVQVRRDGGLASKVHWKYVWPTGQTEPTSDYALVRGGLVGLNGMPRLAYEGDSTLHGWVAAAEQHTATEKLHVDQMVASSARVLDLEMGQPGTALRIDLVELEADSAGLWLQCVEVKRSRDKRVRSAGPRPEVLGQLDAYAEFLSFEANSAAMAKAYGETARVLVALAELAAGVGNPVQLDSLVVRACTEPLRVRPRVALAVVVEGDDGNWHAVHRGKLVASGVEVREVDVTAQVGAEHVAGQSQSPRAGCG